MSFFLRDVSFRVIENTFNMEFPLGLSHTKKQMNTIFRNFQAIFFDACFIGEPISIAVTCVYHCAISSLLKKFTLVCHQPFEIDSRLQHTFAANSLCRLSLSFQNSSNYHNTRYIFCCPVIIYFVR